MLLSRSYLSQSRLSYSLLSRSTLAHSLLDGPVYSTTYDYTTPVQVVNAAYDTSGNGGRKLVRLSNGWLVALVWDSVSRYYYFYVDKMNGSGFVSLCYHYYSANQSGGCIASNGTSVTFLLPYNNASVHGFTFDATTISNTNLETNTDPTIKKPGIESGQTALGTTSLSVDSNGHLHAAWASKNATYPNSFNIRYSKSTDGGATWATPTQITTLNTTNNDRTDPCIVIKGDGNPVIVYSRNGSATNQAIESHNYTGSIWAFASVYNANSSSYGQLSPSSAVDSIGHVHVVWHGKDSTDTTYFNIRYSKSTDGGVTWSAMEKLTSGNTVNRQTPSIAADGNNYPYIAYDDNGTLKFIYNNGAWQSAETIATGTNPSVCANYTNFTKPLTLFDGGTDVKFYGKWTA
jgi:hypothetical protein